MEEVSSSCQSVECDEDNVGNETVKRTVDFDEVNFENETEKINNVEDKAKDPKVGMLFDSINELVEFYKIYGKEKGFGVSIRTSKKGIDGKVRYVTIACTCTGKPRIRSNNPLKFQRQSKTDCKAKLRAVLSPDDKWMVNSMVLDHNHGLSLSESRFYRCHRILPSVKMRHELNDTSDRSGIKLGKSFNSFMIEEGGHENLPFLEKDCKNNFDRGSRLRLGEGDVNAMHHYFLKMQAENSNFFYMMDLDEDGQLRNVFWADARSRASFKEFGDVVTIDTTYLVNKYAMPLAFFIGVNHHGQLTLLGCALISSEDIETLTWLLQSWRTCMFGGPPSAIVTDQDKALGKAVECVFPNSRHRWCLWHVMKNLLEKLRGFKQFESIKFCMETVIYDSITKKEFEESWGRFIEKYELESNEWLLWLYEERNRWVPAFVKDMFWAGMSTIKRNESMQTFFDGYVNSNTTLKQFLEQYENALAKKVENEYNEEFNSFNLCLPCITHYEMEKQFRSVYTSAKFREFQQELIGKIYCNLSSYKEGIAISEYVIGEDVSSGESHWRAMYNVWFNEDTSEVNCNCRLFEYRGILCRHQIVVFFQRKIYQVSDKYILKRWSKTLKRRHTKTRISYDNWSVKPEARRFDKMCNAFYEVTDLAARAEDRCEKVMAWTHNMKEQLKKEEDVCESNKTFFHSCKYDQRVVWRAPDFLPW